MGKASDDGLLKSLRENWFLMLAVVSILTSYTALGVRVFRGEQDFEKHCVNNKELERNQIEMGKQLSTFQNDIQWLKESSKRDEILLHEILNDINDLNSNIIKQ
jgi:hypothetical protein